MPAFVSTRERVYWTLALTLVVVTWATLYWARPLAEWFRNRGWLTELMVLIFAAAAVAVLATVLRRRPGWREVAVLGVFGVAYLLAVLPVMGQPEEALHFVQYGAVGGFFFAALAERGRVLGWSGLRGTLGPALAALVLAIAAGWIDEAIQHVLPNRYYDLRDVGFNAAAAALAIAANLGLRWARSRAEPDRASLDVVHTPRHPAAMPSACPSKSATRSSGSGASKSSGTSKRPASMPKTRRR